MIIRGGQCLQSSSFSLLFEFESRESKLKLELKTLLRDPELAEEKRVVERLILQLSYLPDAPPWPPGSVLILNSSTLLSVFIFAAWPHIWPAPSTSPDCR